MSIRVTICEGALRPIADSADEWPGAGAVVSFAGVVRPTEGDRSILALEYEAYEPMAGRVMADLARDIVRQYGLIGIVAEHSRGRVAVGACAFRVRLAAAHRAEALAALAEFIDRLKRDVPIWKSAVLGAVAASSGSPESSDHTVDTHAVRARIPAAHPVEVLEAFAASLTPVGTEGVAWPGASGRVLGAPLAADRDSPMLDLSAMDGYAVRFTDLRPGAVCRLPVLAEARIGAAPLPLPSGGAARIVTGAAVPRQADTILRREDVDEQPAQIVVPAGLAVTPGQYIRRRGENLAAGATAVSPGTLISPAVAAALATFGVPEPRVYRRVRVGLLVTGDELADPQAGGCAPWQLRDANGPALLALLGALSWIDLTAPRYLRDERLAIAAALADLLRTCDVIIVTGGVSMGHRDHVPAAIADAGGDIAFQRLPIRPGKPIVGARGRGGQAILALPGNPVSVLVTARRFALLALRRLAGLTDLDPPAPRVRVPDAAGAGAVAAGGLWRFVPVRLTGDGSAEVVPTRSSGDVAGAARSDGFVEIPPAASGPGPWPFWTWSV